MKLKKRLPLYLSLFLTIILFSNCGSTPPAASGPAIIPVAIALLLEIVRFFADPSRRDLNLTQSRSNYKDRHIGFFIYRRAKWIGERNNSWVTEANQPRLKARINHELDQVEAYVNNKIGTRSSPGPYQGGTDEVPGTPLLDLLDVSRRKESQSASSRRVRRRRNEFRLERKKRTIAIIWRAAAIHEELWDGDVSSQTPTLRTDALNEILDRRLRAVELMNYTVANGGFMGRSAGGRSWQFQGSDGPWIDHMRLRMFEYPRIHNSSRFRNSIGTSRIADEDHFLFTETSTFAWKKQRGRNRLRYNVSRIRLNGNNRPHWSNPGNNYTIELKPSGISHSAAVELLFQPNTDFWQRSWLFCDHVMSIINVEALIYGKKRREGNASAFNSFVDSQREGYVAMSAFVGWRGNDYLMSDNNDPFFENVAIDIHDLQVGDQLIFWNSFVYTRISDGPWRLENAYVMNVDSDPATGGINMDLLQLQGHGTRVKSHPRYRNEIAQHFAAGVRNLQEVIRRRVRADSSLTSFQWDESTIIKWSPFEEFVNVRDWNRQRRSRRRYLRLGAWWIRIPFAEWGSAAAAVAAIGKSFSDDSIRALIGASATGYTPPPSSGDSVYFPIFEPKNGGWEDYLTNRGASASEPLRTLVAVEIDGSIMPGLFEQGPGRPIDVVRPKVKTP